MIELLLAYERPASLAEREFRSWLAGSTNGFTSTPASLSVEPGTLGGRSVLRLTVDGDPPSASTQDTITGLLGDMRMLGLRPEVIAASDDGSVALAAVLPSTRPARRL
jgi:hypothetical protein